MKEEEGEKVVRRETCFNPDGKEEKRNIFFSFTVFPFQKNLMTDGFASKKTRGRKRIEGTKLWI